MVMMRMDTINLVCMKVSPLYSREGRQVTQMEEAACSKFKTLLLKIITTSILNMLQIWKDLAFEDYNKDIRYASNLARLLDLSGLMVDWHLASNLEGSFEDYDILDMLQT
ncbi:hypothetical protein CEXT_689071 [Caerostris extrusa]|uniref:Uncharacterized protein n=1 Tax=Caerostris extrusa TaxID=172846 RepID=A0AAV4PGZ8_CAEEX|nr:hypothetical protein CEXT_689071 [Caerostris extrusa]